MALSGMPMVYHLVDGAWLCEGERLMAPGLRSQNGTTLIQHVTEASRSDIGYESAHGVVAWLHPSMVLLHNAVHAASASTHGTAGRCMSVHRVWGGVHADNQATARAGALQKVVPDP